MNKVMNQATTSTNDIVNTPSKPQLRPQSRPQRLLPLTLTISALMLSACSNTQKPANKPTTLPKTPSTQTTSRTSTPTLSQSTATVAILDDETLAILEDLLEARDMSMVEGERWQVERYGNLWDRVRRGFRISQPEFNNRIENQKNWFASRQSYLDRLTARASRYLHHTVTEAERRGIPTELALLPIIESSYDPSATSNAAAAGLWQFIPSTGRIYGLNQTNTYDGRRDVIESTRAAYDFLTSLYNQFGSWELALAAYNAGPGRIQRAIDANRAQGLPTDYWSLRLPTETMNYVPRFMAVAQIVNNPSQYGVSFPAIANHSHFRTVPVSYGVSLSDISAATGVAVSELQLLNPALTNLRVDSSGPNRVVIPNSVATSIDARLSAMAAYGNKLPTNAQDLANFAHTTSTATSNQPVSAPAQTTTYIRPSVTSTSTGARASLASTNNTSVINASIKELETTATLPTTTAQLTANNTIVQNPPLSQAERDLIANQIRANAQSSVQPINPTDGNISLEAVQTGQSVLDARGQTKALIFEDQAAMGQSASAVATSAQVATPQATGSLRADNSSSDKQAMISPYIFEGLMPSAQATSDPAPIQADIISSASSTGDTETTATTAADTRISESRPSASKAGASLGHESTYVVQRGDTLSGIASRAGVSLRDLADWNQLNPNANLIVGTRLKLYNAKNPAINSAQSASTRVQSYIVRSGDTLTSIAHANGLTVSQLASYNNLAANARVLTGQKLWLVAGKTPAQNSAQSANKIQTTTYKVQAGESLIGIAGKLGVTTNDIAQLNDFDSNTRLLAGQSIKVPANAARTDTSQQNNRSRRRHTVVTGDTLSSVAAAYNVSTQALASANNMNVNDTLIRGKRLTIPSDGSEASISSTNATTNTQNTASHIVKSGETLSSLANRHGISVARLARLNSLDINAQLRVGQSIKVPKTTNTHTVKSGETLGSLARRYGISLSELAKMNDLPTNAQIRIGQKLTVPIRQ